MKKVFYNSIIAKTILFKNYSTITLAAWVFTIYDKKETTQHLINHECIHAKQWIECAVASGIIIWMLIIIYNISTWWMLLSFLMFYLLYLLEVFIKFFIYGKNAYKNLSFEREAKLAEKDNSYLENSGYFEWIKFIRK